jgi:beta-galactosidase
MKLGVCYYPEQWPRERWAIDAKMMNEAGLSLVRIAEFAWTFMEPEEGEYTWEWLDEAVTTLSEAGLQIILCTPTAAPPAWLCTEYPDVLPVDAQGRRRRFGSRRHYCPTSATYRRHSARIAEAIARRYGSHPSVIAWQIDNEFGLHETARCYCGECAASFRRWLEARYSTLNALNAAWGTPFWNQCYSDWAQIQPPNLTVTEPNPSHVLDYYRFASDTFVSYQQIQIDVLRAHSPGRTITTNFMGNFPDLDYHNIARPLDLVTWDSYPTGYVEMQSETLYEPEQPRPVLAHDVGDPYVTGFCHDLMRGLKQAPFWVMEQQSGHINWSRFNAGVNPGAVRLWTWHALAHGADAVLYFRWRSTLMGQEQYHSGLLHHDTTPAVGYNDVISMRDEQSVMAQLSGQPVQAQVAILLDYDSLWAIQHQPHRESFGYLRHLFLYYQALMRLGITVEIISPLADLSGYRLVISPSHHIADEDHAAHLDAYVRGGGHLLLGVRSGFKTRSNRVPETPLPGPLRNLAGVTVRHWQSLPPHIEIAVDSSISGLGQAQIWVETLEPMDGTETLAHYRDSDGMSTAAITQRRQGSGTVTYMGWYPTLQQAQSLIAHLAAQADIRTLSPLPEGVTAVHRGDCLVLMNFTDSAQTVLLDDVQVSIGPRNIALHRAGAV